MVQDSLIKNQVPWIFTLTKKLPKLKILKSKQENLGEGVYKLEIWVENTSYFPFPTAMGKRNIVTLIGVLVNRKIIIRGTIEKNTFTIPAPTVEITNAVRGK